MMAFFLAFLCTVKVVAIIPAPTVDKVATHSGVGVEVDTDLALRAVTSVTW
jgi:hypothetical protein